MRGILVAYFKIVSRICVRRLSKSTKYVKQNISHILNVSKQTPPECNSGHFMAVHCPYLRAYKTTYVVSFTSLLLILLVALFNVSSYTDSSSYMALQPISGLGLSL
jgi:hypothetical protein